ncbi:MAG: ABC transporter permease [Desulfovibrio sp.]
MRRFFFGFLLFLAVLPLAVLIMLVISPGWRFPQVVPEVIRFETVAYLIGQWRLLLTHLGSSLFYSLCVVATTLCMCLTPAHHFARYSFKGKTILEGLLLAPALVPSMTFSMGVHFMFLKAGIADSLVGIVLVLSVFSYPYMLRALIAGFESYGPEYELCAKNLGAGFFTRLRRIHIPMLLPSVVAGGSVVFLVAFSEYFLVFLIGGGAVPSYTGYLFPYLNASDQSAGAFLTLLFLIIPVVLFLLVDASLSRYYRKRSML